MPPMPNEAFMEQGYDLDVTPQGAALLEGFLAAHQQIIDNPDEDQQLLDGTVILTADGTVMSVIQDRSSMESGFVVTTTGLGDLHSGQPPKVEDRPYGDQWRGGYMRVSTDQGLLKYDSSGRMSPTITPEEGKSKVQLVGVRDLLAQRSQRAEQEAAAQELAEAAAAAVTQEKAARREARSRTIGGRLLNRIIS